MVRVTIDVEHDSGLTDAAFTRSIRDQLDEQFDELKVRLNEPRTICNRVTFQPGLGDSGRKLEIVPETCDYCGASETLRHTNVSPEFSDTIETACLRPNCREYHDGVYDHMFVR